MGNHKRGAGLLAASVGIAAVVTAGFEPLEVLAGWMAAAILRLLISGIEGIEKTKGRAFFTIAASVPIAAGLVWAAEKAFPQESTFPFVSVCVLMLLYRMMIGEKGNAVITGNVLGLCILPLIGVIELFGVDHLDWTQMIPEKISGMRILMVLSAAAPWWAVENRRKEWGWFAASGAASLIMSILTVGILGKGLRAHTDAPFYRAVQGIEIFGKLQRFEALLAAAILMGVFAAVILVGEVLREATEALRPGEYKKSWYFCIVASVFAMELIIKAVSVKKEMWLAGICAVLVLLYGLWLRLSEKDGKSEKSA